MSARSLPPTWRAGAVLVILTVAFSLIWGLTGVIYQQGQSVAPTPAPSFSPVQLPTLEVEP